MLTIATLVDKNEDFIKLQYNSIKRFVKNDVKYIVFNNASTETQRDIVSRACDELGVECFNIYSNYSLDFSQIHAMALNTAWRVCLSHIKGTLMFLDSDMFFIKDTVIGNFDFDVAYIPQYRDNGEVEYMWAGLFILNMDTINTNIDFSICNINGDRTDSGGGTYYFLKDSNYKKIYLRFSHLADIPSEEELLIDINGCSGLLKVSKLDSSAVFSPHEVAARQIYKDYLKHLELIEKYAFPKPYIFDLIRKEPDGNYFLFHFKNGNWGPQYNPEHLSLKKAALIKMLADLGVEVE